MRVRERRLVTNSKLTSCLLMTFAVPQRSHLHCHSPPLLTAGRKNLVEVEEVEELLVEQVEEPC